MHQMLVCQPPSKEEEEEEEEEEEWQSCAKVYRNTWKGLWLCSSSFRDCRSHPRLWFWESTSRRVCVFAYFHQSQSATARMRTAALYRLLSFSRFAGVNGASVSAAAASEQTSLSQRKYISHTERAGRTDRTAWKCPNETVSLCLLPGQV